MKRRLVKQGTSTMMISLPTKWIKENKLVAKKGGFAAKKARLEIEKQTGESVIDFKNAKQLRLGK